MQKEVSKIKYFLYARKSSESEDKQMASIDAQINELTRYAEERGLEILDVLSESKSAKAPGRPIFTKMIERINKGEANGILCWKLNRLARNPIDGGTISWLLQQGIIQHVQAFGSSYYPQDNVIMMAVELGMANQYVRDLMVDTKRGLKAKAERGWYPAYATLGYIHNPLKKKGEKEILEDSERFNLVRKTFDLMLTGQYTPPKILEIATDEWNLRNRKGQRIGRSTMYRIFSDPFYYGEFEYPKGSGLWHKGNHKPMITREEYDRIQVLLGRRGNTRPKIYDFLYRGQMHCGECGALITAEHKVKRQKNGVVRFYTFYHCTKRKNPNCTQGSIEEKEVERQVMEILGSLEIPPEFHEWAMDVLKTRTEQEAKDRNRIFANQRSGYDKALQMVDNLIRLRASNEINESEFARLKAEAIHEKERWDELLKDSHKQVDNWIQTADAYFEFAEKARFMFENGAPERRKGIFASLGSNLLLKDRKINVSLHEPLMFIQKIAPEAKMIAERFEPQENVIDKKKIGHLYAQSPMMLPLYDEIRTYFIKDS